MHLPEIISPVLQGDFYQWLALFNHFDAYYDKHVAPRADLQLKVPGEEGYSQPEQLPARTLEQMLKFTAVVLENCSNKHVYHSYEVCRNGCHGRRLSALDKKCGPCAQPAGCASLTVPSSSAVVAAACQSVTARHCRPRAEPAGFFLGGASISKIRCTSALTTMVTSLSHCAAAPGGAPGGS